MSQWLSEVLGKKCRLIKQHPGSKRAAKFGQQSDLQCLVLPMYMHASALESNVEVALSLVLGICSRGQNGMCGEQY